MMFNEGVAVMAFAGEVVLTACMLEMVMRAVMIAVVATIASLCIVLSLPKWRTKRSGLVHRLDSTERLLPLCIDAMSRRPDCCIVCIALLLRASSTLCHRPIRDAACRFQSR